MLQITKTESKVLLTLFKDFSTNYNANTLAKKIGITRAGALKILKKFKAKEILVSKRFGQAVFYKLNLEDQYVHKILETMLMAEAREKANRWIWEFKDFFPHLHAAVIFGSAIRQYEKAHDIDIAMIFEVEKLKVIREMVREKNNILIKPIHLMIQSPRDIVKNVCLPDPVIINAFRYGYVLHGYSEIIEAVHKALNAHGVFAVPEPITR